MKRFFHRSILYINLIFALALAASYISIYFPPDRFWIAAFFGLACPFFLAVNALFLLYWIILRRPELLVSLIMILGGASYLDRIIRIPIQLTDNANPSNISVKDSDTLHILSYNVRAFNLYDWAHNPKAANGILDFVASSKADIICFQEFYSRAESRLLLKEIPKGTDIAPHAHIYYYFQDKEGGRYGIATYSKFPIVRKGAIKFENTYNVCIYTDLRIGNDTIRIYNSHLQSVRFRKANFDFLDTMKLKYNERQFVAIKDISYRLKNAYIKRTSQVNAIAGHIRKCPYPVIVCGDLNDTPVSYTYHTIRGNLKDSYEESGIGDGTTYKRPWSSFRIDYIFYGKNFRSCNFKTINIPYSDHFPVYSYLIRL